MFRDLISFIKKNVFEVLNFLGKKFSLLVKKFDWKKILAKKLGLTVDDWLK